MGRTPPAASSARVAAAVDVVEVERMCCVEAEVEVAPLVTPSISCGQTGGNRSLQEWPARTRRKGTAQGHGARGRRKGTAQGHGKRGQIRRRLAAG